MQPYEYQYHEWINEQINEINEWFKNEWNWVSE